MLKEASSRSVMQISISKRGETMEKLDIKEGRRRLDETQAYGKCNCGRPCCVHWEARVSWEFWRAKFTPMLIDKIEELEEELNRIRAPNFAGSPPQIIDVAESC